MEKEFNLIIDYSRTLEEMISAGAYDWIHGRIKGKRFSLPTELKGKQVLVSAKLFNFNRLLEHSNAIAGMDRAFYSATLVELLALGEGYPDLQRQFPIIGAGSFWRSFPFLRYVPVLTFNYGKRDLDLQLRENWGAQYHFLGIKKQSLQILS